MFIRNSLLGKIRLRSDRGGIVSNLANIGIKWQRDYLGLPMQLKS